MFHPRAPIGSASIIAAMISMALLTSGCGRERLTASTIADFIDSNRPSDEQAPQDAPPNQGNNETSVNVEASELPLSTGGIPTLPAILYEYANVQLPAHFRGPGPGGSV
ncbi:TPA: hypothetical protein DCE37_16765, partial [Candidatus Latescibacteria bacterium]|nr:hypothetical protein [Candidatus Latescibacterota bacterium]